MKNSENMSQGLLKLLALDHAIDFLKNTAVSSDLLTWKRVCGSIATVLVILLFLSGAFMALYYSPYPGAAYDSVQYAEFDLPFGDVIRGIHHWSWNLLLVVMLLHMTRAFFTGAYKPPREMVWVSGVLLLLVVPLAIITGDLLPWTQAGFWTTRVRVSIISSVPVIGPFMVDLLQGGPRTGIVALTRFYVLHVIFLPAGIIFLLALHFYFLRLKGLADPITPSRSPKRNIALLPDMANRWLILFIVVTLAIGIATRLWFAVPYGDPADPSDSRFVPKPEWWVLFLNQLVSIFKGPFTVVGSAVIPGFLAGLLLMLPFISRSPERHPVRRWKEILVAMLIAAAILGLSVMSWIEHFTSAAA